MTGRYKALITPEVLHWARLRVHMPLEVAARKLNVTPDRLNAWEQGEDLPSISQAKDIANLYKRPLAIFYLPDPPEPIDMLHDFRRLPDSDQREPSPALMFEIDRAEYQRNVALQLLPPDQTRFAYLNTISIADDSEVAATRARQWIGIDLKQQFEWRGDKNMAFRHWKNAIERLGVLVLQTSHYRGQSFPLEEARGFSIGEAVLPVIMINAKDQLGGRIFTLMHEFAHLLLNATGICDLREVRRPQTEEQRIEVFCNRVAGAVLVPAAALLGHQIVQQHDNSSAWTDEELARLARGFAVSEEMLLRRLTLLGLASDDFYRKKHEEYELRYAEMRQEQQGGPPRYEYMVLRQNGTAYTRMVLEAYYQERITLNKVADYLGIRLKHLDKVERAAYSGLAFE